MTFQHIFSMLFCLFQYSFSPSLLCVLELTRLSELNKNSLSFSFLLNLTQTEQTLLVFNPGVQTSSTKVNPVESKQHLILNYSSVLSAPILILYAINLFNISPFISFTQLIIFAFVLCIIIKSKAFSYSCFPLGTGCCDRGMEGRLLIP